MGKYLFLHNQVHSPKEVDVPFGSRVVITKRDGDEVWFDFVSKPIKGYVVYPNLFVEDTKANRLIIQSFRKKIKEAKRLEKEAYAEIQKIPTLK